ncbi:MAG: response regulator [Kofleriaceae bacterium]|nr:response regulator [Kofleriaceae bacterium]
MSEDPKGGWRDANTTLTSVTQLSTATVKSSDPTACIVHVSENSSSTRTRVLDRDELTVGRGQDCSLVIPCSHVSRVHVRICKEGDSWHVYDNGSVNGILINGTKRDFAELSFGDRIDLGRGELLLYRPYDSDYQRVLEAQKLESLGRLASGIAHDFNNVLMAIVGAATCLSEDVRSGDLSEVDATVDDIMTASDRGADLARQLLSFSRRGKYANDLIGVSDVVLEVTRLVERTFDQKIAVTTSMNSSAAVIANRSQLTQVLMNLCINARDAMPHGGELHVSVRDAQQEESNLFVQTVCIEVKDTGIGMTPEVRERIFEPFFSTKGEGRGTGLGMSTTYGIVKACGGSLDIKSELGVGTSILVYLPAQSMPAVPTPVQPDMRTQLISPTGKGRKILLAEDQELVRRHTSRILRRMGFTVIEAVDGVEAVEAVKAAESPISLAMLDLQMPKRSGDEACRMIRSLDPGLPIIMVSGNTEDSRIGALVDSERVGVLSKPFGPQELAQALMQARQ